MEDGRISESIELAEVENITALSEPTIPASKGTGVEQIELRDSSVDLGGNLLHGGSRAR